ncbi:RDD family protein [Acidocella sp. MX-AZ03]|uniref:RDD family protein n=1 Tax=Acidocella sp. MX-AZ03 TaxID=2697363 RepID=UPI0022DD3540|nr:RDD family protein [Acidocella sp. MX-AZ03]WBO60312.1 RDD family protein [Acidocella sp. MX-AZ03]
MSQTLYYPPSPEQTLFHGVITRRCAALLLDMIGMALFGWAMVFAIAIFGVLTFGFGWIAFHILPWLPLVYYTLLIGGTGATPGQRLTGIVVRQDATLAPPAWPRPLSGRCCSGSASHWPGCLSCSPSSIRAGARRMTCSAA